MIPSEHIYDTILSQLTLNFPVFIGPSPGLNTSHTSIFDSGSDANPKWLRDRYSFQIFGNYEREDYAKGYNDMNAIRDALLGRDNQVTTDGVWSNFILVNGPSFIGVSDSMSQFSMNFQATFDADSGTHRDVIA